MIIEIEQIDKHSERIKIVSGAFTIVDQTVSYPPSIQEIVDIEARVCRSMDATGDRKMKTGSIVKDVVIDRVAAAVHVGRSRLNEIIMSMQYEAAGQKDTKAVPWELIRHLPKADQYENAPQIEAEDDTKELVAEIERTQTASGNQDELSAVSEKIQRLKQLAQSQKRC